MSMPELPKSVIALRHWYASVRELCSNKGWREHSPGQAPKEGHIFAAYVALGHSEFSEMLEAYRDKVWSETCPGRGDETALVRVRPEFQAHIKGCSGKPHDAPKPVGVGPEMADVFIRLIDMADMWGIDMDYEVARVMAYGWTRSYRHGGRQL